VGRAARTRGAYTCTRAHAERAVGCGSDGTASGLRQRRSLARTAPPRPGPGERERAAQPLIDALSCRASQGWQGRRGARGAKNERPGAGLGAPSAPARGAGRCKKMRQALLDSMMMSLLFDLRVRTGSAWPGRGPFI
jgi:hypothetical protein